MVATEDVDLGSKKPLDSDKSWEQNREFGGCRNVMLFACSGSLLGEFSASGD